MDYPNAGMARRLAAMLYDFFLLIAIAMLTMTIVIVLFNSGEAVDGKNYRLFLFFEIFLFYFIFWKIKGQTLGMQVWKIKTVSNDGQILSSSQCIIRFLAATLSFLVFGAGFFWMLISKEKLTWHDSLSDSRVIYLGVKPFESEKKTQSPVRE